MCSAEAEAGRGVEDGEEEMGGVKGRLERMGSERCTKRAFE